MENKKLNFFSRIKKAVCKFDDYEFFINEKVRVAIFYILKLLILASIIVSLAITYKVSNQLEILYHNIFDNIPEFEFKEGNLNSMQTLEKIDEEQDFYFLIDTTELKESQIAEYRNKMENYSSGVILLKDKFIYRINNTVEHSYSNILSAYGTDDISFNKEEAMQYITESVKGFSLYSGIFAVISIAFFVITLISVISDIIILSLLGIITSRIAKLKLKYSSTLVIAIYSLTLPIILLTAYDVASTLTNFNIDFFSVIYISIGYIYVIAAILLIKSEIIKQTVEVGKIIEEQENVRKEFEENEEKQSEKDDTNEQENKEEDKKQNEENTGIGIKDNEPDGSEI